MRIISQGGNADLPYEEIALCMACEDIIARHNDKEYLMARYSTVEKAKKAMEMLQEEYRFEKLFETLCSGMGDYPNKPFYYFQFPQDEDVEV